MGLPMVGFGACGVSERPKPLSSQRIGVTETLQSCYLKNTNDSMKKLRAQSLELIVSVFSYVLSGCGHGG